MSRDLAAHEKEAFGKLYGTGTRCEKCGDPGVIIRIWEKYGAAAYMVGGDITPQGIVAAVVICEHCGHGEVVSRQKIEKAAAMAS
jgi:hypothetical protein